MAQTAHLNAPTRGLGQILAAPFKAFGNFLIAMSEASPRMKQIERLTATTDEQLAALGKTREGEIRRILGAQHYI